MRLMLIYPLGEVVSELLERGNSVCGINCFSAVRIPTDKLAGDVALATIHGDKKIDFQAIRQLRRKIEEFRPDIIHAFTPFTLSWSLFATSFMPRSRRPSVVSFRGITRPLRRFDVSDLISYNHPRVAWHVCESEAIRQAMIGSGCNADRCYVTYNCVTSPTPTETREAIRERWQLTDDDFVVGTIASLRPVKGIDILLKAAVKLDNPKMRWVVIGSGNDPATNELAKHPALSKNIRMLGKIYSAANLIHAFDLFVMPSRSEGLCRSLIEAMEQRLPSVVSDAGGMKELIRHGIDGLVVPKEDHAALAMAIEQLNLDGPLRRTMGSSAKVRVSEMCSPKAVTDRLESVYQRVLRNRTA